MKDGPVLIVAAHPDDEVLGAGGTIARLGRSGADVHVAILGEGAASRWSNETAEAKAAIATLTEQSRAVRDRLGARSVERQSLPDNRFDTVPLLDIAKLVESLIERHHPVAVYTHHASDLNVDHRMVAQAVLTATRPIGNTSVRRVYAWETLSSTEWSFGQLAPSFVANVFVDISDTLADKIAAMRLYEDELRPFPHPRSPEAIEAAARRWGSVAGMPAAEPFQLVRELV